MGRCSSFLWVDSRFLFLAAFLLLVLPIKWLLAAVIAAAVHEAGHLLTLRLTGGRVEQIHIGGSGACIYASTLNQRRELISVLFGPLASLLLVAGVRLFPRIAICGLVQGLYNLIPIWPLDGGKALKIVLHRLLPPERAKRVRLRVEKFCWLAAAALIFWVSYTMQTWLLPVFFLPVFRKFPCKESQDRVQ